MTMHQAKKAITRWDRPAHSHNMAPCIFLLFQKLEIASNEQRFTNISNIQQNVRRLLNNISEYEFQGYFQKW